MAKSVVIVDYGMGNLFSIRQACAAAGMEAELASTPEEIHNSAGIILPGVGAFEAAMGRLREQGLVNPLREVAAAGVPLLGICLGLQLLMERSFEFGVHEGLGLIEGDVVSLRDEGESSLKVPHIGWNWMRPPQGRQFAWEDSLLSLGPCPVPFYFVHSFHARPLNPGVVLAETAYGNLTFPSALKSENIHAFQGHPERSGEKGLMVYKAFRELLLP